VGGAPVRITPAIGAGGRLPRRILIRRYALALTLILALGLGKILIANKAISTVSLTLPDRVVTSGLIIGAAPADTDLEDFAADFSVDAVVNVGSPSVAEQVTTASLHQAYLYLAMPVGAAPTWTQLRPLAGFMRRYTERGNWVYLHDDRGGSQAVTTVAMLLLLRGQTWTAVVNQITPAGLRSLDARQQLALNQLISALHQAGPQGPQGPQSPQSREPSGNPYAAASLEPW
jgi:hypothetical protein